jgi:hypothetical protein
MSLEVKGVADTMAIFAVLGAFGGWVELGFPPLVALPFFLHQSGYWPSIPPPGLKHLSIVCLTRLQLGLEHISLDWFDLVWVVASA